METYSGKTLEDAITAAAAAKSVQKAEISYSILEENAGFLGLGGKVSILACCKADIIAYLKNFIQTYFQNIEMEAEITIEEVDEYLHINLNGANNAILIGKNGIMLQAINTVVKAIANNEFKKRIKLLVDINGYKEEKYEKVMAIAKRIAHSVQKTKIAAVLDPMPADERKAIHNVLTGLKNIATQSEGEGNFRRIKICYKEE